VRLAAYKTPNTSLVNCDAHEVTLQYWSSTEVNLIPIDLVFSEQKIGQFEETFFDGYSKMQTELKVPYLAVPTLPVIFRVQLCNRGGVG
jgi:hypothetical protein